MTGNDELEKEDAEIFKNSLEEHFGEIEDYRREGSINHKIINILFITICGVISVANNLKAVSVYAFRKRKWLTEILELKNGVPSYTAVPARRKSLPRGKVKSRTK